MLVNKVSFLEMRMPDSFWNGVAYSLLVKDAVVQRGYGKDGIACVSTTKKRPKIHIDRCKDWGTRRIKVCWKSWHLNI